MDQHEIYNVKYPWCPAYISLLTFEQQVQHCNGVKWKAIPQSLILYIKIFMYGSWLILTSQHQTHVSIKGFSSPSVYRKRTTAGSLTHSADSVRFTAFGTGAINMVTFFILALFWTTLLTVSTKPSLATLYNIKHHNRTL